MGQYEIWAADTDLVNWGELTNGLGGREPAWQPVLPCCYERRSPVVGTDQIAAFNGYLINRASCVGAVRKPLLRALPLALPHGEYGLRRPKTS